MKKFRPILIFNFALVILIILGFVLVIFQPQPAKSAPDWFSGWSYRKEIIIDHTQVDATLSNFPVLIDLSSDSDLAADAQDDGDDILFTSSDGTTKLDHEIEKFDGSTGQLVAWVKITSLSSSTDTPIYMYYGNPGASNQESVSATWSNGFAMVYHLGEPSGTAGSGSVVDSTANTSGTPSSGILFGQSGQVGTTADFSSGTGINCGSIGSPLLTAETTVSYWIYKNANNSRQNPFDQAYGGWGTHTNETNGTINWYFGSNGGNSSPYGSHGSSSSMLSTTGTWVYVTAVRNPSGYTYEWYKNGSFLNGSTYNSTYPVINTRTFTIGDGYVNPINGKIDEFRVSSSARSANWISTSYNNQNNPGVGGFLASIGGEEEEEPAVEVDGTPSSTIFGAVSNVTLSHTTGSGSNMLMLVSVTLTNDQGQTVSGVTYNGDALTQVGRVERDDDAVVDIWSRVAPDIGTFDVVVSFTGAVQRGTVGAMTFTGVDQTTPLGTFVSTFGDLDPISVNVTSAIGELVFDTVACETCGSFTALAGQTEQWDLNDGTAYGAASTEPGASTVTMSWDLGNIDHVALGAVPIKPAAAVSALVGHWKFDEGSGTIAGDSSGNGNDGTLINMDENDWVDGRINNALDFDEVDDRITITKNEDIKPSNITIAFWMNTSEDTSVEPWNGSITGPYGNGYSSGWRTLDYNNRPRIQMNFGDPTPVGPTGNAMGVGNWHHVVVTYDHTYLRLYQNGISVGTPVSETRDINWITTGDLSVGFAQNYFYGLIDDVRIYNYALSATEVEDLYNAAPSIPTVDIKADGSDGPITITYNTSANLTWTSTDATSCTASGDWPVTGNKDTSGSESTGNLTSSKTYTLICTGPGGTSPPDSVTVNVTPAAGITYVSSNSGAATSITLDIGSQTGDRLLVIHVSDETTINHDTLVITVGGTTSCNEVVDGVNIVGAGNYQAMFYCDDDDLGSLSGVVSIAETSGTCTGTECGIIAQLFTGVSQNGPIDFAMDTTSIDNSVEASIDVPANGLVVMGAGNGSSGTWNTWTSPLIEREDFDAISGGAPFGAASGVESSAQTNKQYQAVASANPFNRGSCVVASWAEAGAAALVGHWKLDENGGTTAGDSSGSGNDGTIYGATSWTTGKFGYALDFDDTQTTQYIDLPYTVLNGLSDYTIAFWAYGGGSGEYIISGSDGTNHNYMLMHGPTAPGWHFYVWRRGGGYGTHIYQDLIETDSLIYSNPGDPINLVSGGFIIAQEQDSLGGGFDPNQAFSGMIDDIRIYNYALSASEIQSLYDAAGLVGHWKFDEGSGTIAGDSSGSGNDGTLINMDDNDWVAGRINNALDFDGDDHVDCGPPDFNIGTGDYTVIAWVYPTTFVAAYANPVVALGLYDPSWLIQNTAGSTAKLGIWDTDWKTWSNGTISLNEWSHVVWVREGTGTDEAKYYINGAYDSSITYSDSIGDATIRIANDGHTNYFTGTIDDVRIYDYALSASEIQGIYNAAPPLPPDFSISADPISPTPIKAPQTGTSQTSTITISSINNYNSAVTLSIAGLPAGATANFSDNPITPIAGGSITSDLTINTSNVTIGSYPLTVQGTDGTITHTTSVTLEVVDLSADLFVATDSTTWQDSLTGTIPLNGVDAKADVGGSASGTINYSFWCDCPVGDCAGLPSPVPGSCVTNAVGAKCDGMPEAQTTITIDNLCDYGSEGIYTLKVKTERDVADPVYDTATITVTVVPDFNISASLTTIKAPQNGTSQTSVITIDSINDFNSFVNLSVSGLPAGATANLTPSSVTPPANGSVTSNLVISTAEVADGSYVLTVQGQSLVPAITKTTIVTLEVVSLLVDLKAALDSATWQDSLTGVAPLNGVDAKADVDGSAIGTINYSFWCDCPFGDCTGLPTPTIGNCLTNAVGAKCEGVSETTKTFDNLCDYGSQGTYTLKVKIERDVAEWVYGTVTVTVLDTTPPERSNGQPTGTRPSGTTSETISLDTNENATCKYDTSQGVAYASMPVANTFSGAGTQNHSIIVTGLLDGNTYNYYVKCEDEASIPNPNISDFPISFDIAPPPPFVFLVGNWTSMTALETGDWFTGWNYRKKITIAGQSGAGTNYQAKILVGESSGTIGTDVNVDGHSSSTTIFGDIRFTDNDGFTLLDYWQESVTGVSPNRIATFWVEVADNLDTNQEIYIYYGNSGVSSVSNGPNTFAFFDDFPGTSLDTDKWATTGAYSVNNGITITTGSVYTNLTVASSPQNLTLEMKAKFLNGAASYSGLEIANAQSTQGSNSGSNALAYNMTQSGAGYNLSLWGANGTASSYNIVAGGILGTPTLNTDYIIGFSFYGSSQISYFYQNLSYSDINRLTHNGTWSQAFYLWLGYFTGSAAGGVNIDDILVSWVRARKYASIEPSVSLVGGEEEPALGMNYTPGAGFNRVVLIMVTSESDTNPVANVNQITLGGQALTAIENADGVVVGEAGSYHNVLWFGYLDQAGIGNMNGNAINITWDQAPNNPVEDGKTMVQAATYDGVNQFIPIEDSANNSHTWASSIQAGSVRMGEGDKLIYVSVIGNPANHTKPGGYTEHIEQDGDPNTHSDVSVSRNDTTASIKNPTATWDITQRLAIISVVLNSAGGAANAPIVINRDETNVTETAARLEGEVTYNGGENPTVRIYWGDNDGGTDVGSWDTWEDLGIKGPGTFFEDISGLAPSTTYYYRCFATNSGGNDWADTTEQFDTIGDAPIITNHSGATNVTATTARLEGEVTYNGGEDPTVRIYWGTSDEGTNSVSWDNENDLGTKGIGTFFEDIGPLTPLTTYYYRCFATNSGGDDWADTTEQFTTIIEWTGTTTFETSGMNYTPKEGSNRLVLVMVTSESTTNSVANVNQITLGGRTLTAIENADGVVVGSAGSYHNIIWLGYLNQDGITNMSGNAINITWDQAPNIPYGETMVQAATYVDVNQIAPIANSASNFNTSTDSIQPGSVTVDEGDRIVYVSVHGQPANHTPPFSYTEHIEQVGLSNAHSNVSVSRNDTTANIENPTAIWSSVSRLAIISAVLKRFDDTPPECFNGQPTGTLSAGTTSAALSLNTDEDATCKYDTSPETAYNSMTIFTTTGGTFHTSNISGLLDDTTYNYYVKCRDPSGNTTEDYPIIFAVGIDIAPIFGWAWGGGNHFPVPPDEPEAGNSWLSFSSSNCDSDGNGLTDTGNYSQCPTGQPISSYGVDINLSTGEFLGHAWMGGGEELGLDIGTLGWIDFAPAGIYPSCTGCPDYSAKIDFETGKVNGWAKAEAGGNGWDGWILLGKETGGWANQVTIDLTTPPQRFHGWAWGSDVVGWINFNCEDRASELPDPDFCSTVSDYKVEVDINFPPSVDYNRIDWECCVDSRHPTFYWDYEDPVEGFSQGYYQVQVDETIDFSSATLKLDTGEIFSSAGSYVVKTSDIQRGIDFDWGQTYYWRVRARDDRGSGWSSWTVPSLENLSVSKLILPTHPYPDIRFTWSPRDPSARENIGFTSNQDPYKSICYDDDINGSSCLHSTKGGNEIYNWTFTLEGGDGSEEPNWDADDYLGGYTYQNYDNPVVSFSHPGRWDVTLEITDGSGEAYSCTSAPKPVRISDPLPWWKEVIPR